jgi:ABC-2 type transport system permease protein
VAAFGVPLLVLGGTFFPAELLPPFLLRVAYFDPIYHMNAALRPVWARGAGWSEVGLHVLCLLLFAALSLALGTRAYGSMLQRERTS